MTVSIWQEARDAVDQSVDVVVIGAGIVGSYAAWLLGERGLVVAHVDAFAQPARGASGRNGGFVLTAQRDPYPMLVERSGRQVARTILGHVRDSVARMRALCIEHGLEVGGAPVRLAESAADVRELERWARLFEEDGVAVDFQHTDPMGAGYLASMRVESDFVTQPAQLTRAIAASAKALPFFGSEVFAIEEPPGHSGCVVHAENHRFNCQHVFIATNGYAGELHPFLRSLIQPARGQIIATPPTAPVMPCAGIGHTGYFRQLEDGRVLMGGARAFFIDQENTSEDATTPNLHAKLQEYLKRWFPAIDHTIERSWAGIQGFTRDRRAIIGTLPDLAHVGFAVGFSGYGNSIGLVAAELMVEHVLDGRDPGPFSIHRPTLST